jgi:hypothetical protein
VAPPLFGADLAALARRLSFELSIRAVPVLRDVEALRDVSVLRTQHDDLRRSNVMGLPISHLRWSVTDRVINPPHDGYAPPPPDTVDAWPYSHTGCVRLGPDDSDHRLLEALRVVTR